MSDSKQKMEMRRALFEAWLNKNVIQDIPGCADFDEETGKYKSKLLSAMFVAWEAAWLLSENSKWISVEEALPPLGVPVFGIYEGKIGIFDRYEEGGEWFWCRCEGMNGDGSFSDSYMDNHYPLTHWLPLPSPLIVKKEEG